MKYICENHGSQCSLGVHIRLLGNFQLPGSRRKEQLFNWDVIFYERGAVPPSLVVTSEHVGGSGSGLWGWV